MEFSCTDDSVIFVLSHLQYFWLVCNNFCIFEWISQHTISFESFNGRVLYLWYLMQLYASAWFSRTQSHLPLSHSTIWYWIQTVEILFVIMWLTELIVRHRIDIHTRKSKICFLKGNLFISHIIWKRFYFAVEILYFQLHAHIIFFYLLTTQGRWRRNAENFEQNTQIQQCKRYRRLQCHESRRRFWVYW
jgi:hypothetical protein